VIWETGRVNFDLATDSGAPYPCGSGSQRSGSAFIQVSLPQRLINHAIYGVTVRFLYLPRNQCLNPTPIHFCDDQNTASIFSAHPPGRGTPPTCNIVPLSPNLLTHPSHSASTVRMCSGHQHFADPPTSCKIQRPSPNLSNIQAILQA
jgi:hypothetical protein